MNKRGVHTYDLFQSSSLSPSVFSAQLKRIFDEVPADQHANVLAGHPWSAAHANSQDGAVRVVAPTRFFAEQRERLGFVLRVVRLGHVQRSGTPGVFDRLLATRMGAAVTECIACNEFDVFVGLAKGEIVSTPLEQIVGKKKTLDPHLLNLARVLGQ
jgi:6-phosphofructokinase